ncbi:MAG: 16S rRNA (guanine(527)-N(7))-methyltransferase RsmG [bacterium]
MSAGTASSLSHLERLLSEPDAPVSVASQSEIPTVHLADSRVGLEFSEARSATCAADIGSGAGLPGLPLAASLPETEWVLIEATGKKCRFIERAVSEMGLTNVQVEARRTEEFSSAPEGREAFDLVTARAVGSLATTAELASPLLRPGGHLLIWRGARDSESERVFEGTAGERLALDTVEVRSVSPYPGSRDRHIHLLRKNGPTPEGLPRRPGMASKRPLGIE